MAEIVPFPLCRRHGFITRQASWFAEQSPSAAEKNLRRQIDVQADALRRRGVADAVVERECSALDAAIRATALRLLLSPGGVA